MSQNETKKEREKQGVFPDNYILVKKKKDIQSRP